MFKLIAKISKFFYTIARTFLHNYFDGSIKLSSDLYINF